MPYTGRPVDSTGTARQIIYEVLDQQPGSNGAMEIQVTDEKFSVLRSRSNVLLGTSGIYGTTIYYTSIGEMRLSRKRAWFAVTIRGANGVNLLYVYTADRHSAERFIDALETMRRGADTRTLGEQ
jgi:DUF2075 family protein